MGYEKFAGSRLASHFCRFACGASKSVICRVFDGWEQGRYHCSSRQSNCGKLWLINCPNCVEEIKLLNQLVDEYKGKGDVVFLGPAASKKPDLEKFLKKNPFKYQVIPDSTITILTKFGTPDKTGDINVPFPMHYVLDREGKVVVKVQGIKSVDAVRKELRKQLP